MRISDWSSDVCSSDLGAGIDDRLEIRRLDLVELAGRRGVDQVEQAREAVAQIEAAAAAMTDVEDAPQLGVDLLQVVAIGVLPEIGRASCRERVCQYVSCSVVAVSLKQKSYKSHTD